MALVNKSDVSIPAALSPPITTVNTDNATENRKSIDYRPSDDIEPENALKMLQNQEQNEVPPESNAPLANSTLNLPSNQSDKTRLSRDEQLAESQKLIPLQMRSSFLPYEAVPRDIFDQLFQFYLHKRIHQNY